MFLPLCLKDTSSKMIIPIEWLEFLRPYEAYLIDFYHEHYFLLIVIIMTICMVIFLVPFGIAWRRADRELEEERRAKEKADAGKLNHNHQLRLLPHLLSLLVICREDKKAFFI